MKRFILLLGLLAFSCLGAQARDGGFVLKGGFNKTNVSWSDLTKPETYKSDVGWEAGLGFKTGTALGFSLQPELIFKQSVFSAYDEKIKLNSVEIPVNIQWGIDLIAFRPFAFISPFFGMNLNNFTTEPLASMFKDPSRFEYGLGLGAGIDVWKLQFTAMYNWNFGSIATWDIVDAAQQIKDLDLKTGLFEFGIAVVF